MHEIDMVRRVTDAVQNVVYTDVICQFIILGTSLVYKAGMANEHKET